MAAFAVYQDIEDVWRPLSAAEQTVATNLLEHASTMLRGRFPTIDQRIADGSLSAEMAQLAVVQMVKRVLDKPSGAVQSETRGPFSVRWRDDARGELEVTRAEVALVAPPTATAAGSIFVTPGLR